MEEFQEADVLWPWPDTPPPSPEEEAEEGSYDYDYDVPAAAPELYVAVVDFSCEPFSEPASSSWSWISASSATSSTLSALLLLSDGGVGFFLSDASTVSAAGLQLGASEEFLEADVLWPDPDTADDDEAEGYEFLWRRQRRSRRIEEAAAVFRGKREGCSGPLAASSPIDIPMATRGGAAAARRRRP